MISIVSPFYNEQTILASSLDHMLSNLHLLPEAWELIVVNDGSTDDSLNIAMQKAAATPHLRVISYDRNQGRGYALKQGIDAARGDIIVTTEIDCSWGDSIVASLSQALRADPHLDVVIASTNQPNGNYTNVPCHRVILSRVANFFLGLTVSQKITMFTGMTRGYKALAIKQLPISETGKEFHLDVIAKAMAFGFKIAEIPATITWKDEKLSIAGALKRKSSSKIPNIIGTHILFGLSSRPYRYLFLASLITFLFTGMFLGLSLANFMANRVSVFLLILSMSSFILTLLLAGFGVITLQQNTILREIWILRKELKEHPTHNVQ